MSEKLLPSSLDNGRFARAVRIAAIAVGALVVLWGAADLTSRMAQATLGPQAGLMIFGPAAAVQNPAALNALTGSSTPAGQGDPLVPARLNIPSIGVSAPVESVGQRADGAMAAPSNFTDVAWYAAGGKPGGQGSAVFAGHVNNALTRAGVFAHLDQVHLGDYVTVSSADGHALIYKVTAIDEYPADQAPAQSIFAATGPSQLVLITCEGDWVAAEKSFNKRLVVTAIPVYTGLVR